MTPRRSGVTVVGSLHYDIVVSDARLPRRGETVMASAWSPKCGGKGGNQAVECARHGVATTMVACTGDDDFGDALRTNLAGSMVDIAHVRVTDAAGSGMSVALLDADGEYGAVIVPGSNWLLRDDDIKQAEALLKANRVLLLQNEIRDEINLLAARTARAGGGFVILNAAPARRLSPELLQRVDLLVVNAVEAEDLGAGRVETAAAAAGAADCLCDLAEKVVVTAGAAGLAHAARGRPPAILAAHRVEAVNTHGAGDAFVGALAARLSQGEAFAAAVTYANAAAALFVSTAEAARPMLTAASCADFLRRHGVG